MDGIIKANNYISEHKDKVNGKYRPEYHMLPPVGWMNDPNGLIYFGGRYHLYYQFNPYAPEPGTMYWGHFASDDLISYESLGVAVAPQQEYSAIFSGGAIECGGKIHALYTLHTEKEGFKSEEVYSAVSGGGAFGAGKKVFDNNTLPDNISRTDFRDPCPVKVGDMYYVFIGGKDVNLNAGVIIVLSGKTLDELVYSFYIGPFAEFGEMGECPSYFKTDGKDVLICSGCRVQRRGNDFLNENSSVFVVGDIDFGRKTMTVDFIKEIDKGDTFYAPQFIRGIEKPVMIGWLEMWGKPYPTKEMGHGWVGAFSIPRELTYKDGDIFQQPVESLKSYRTAVSRGLPASADITLKFNGNGSLKIYGENGSVTVGCDGVIYLDTLDSNNMCGCIRRTNREYADCEVRILLDVSGIEVFVDGGREVISSRIYIDGISGIKTQGNVKTVEVYAIEVVK